MCIELADSRGSPTLEPRRHTVRVAHGLIASPTCVSLDVRGASTDQHLFTDTDLDRHMRGRPAGLDHQAGCLLPKLRVYFRRLPDIQTAFPQDERWVPVSATPTANPFSLNWHSKSTRVITAFHSEPGVGSISNRTRSHRQQR